MLQHVPSREKLKEVKEIVEVIFAVGTIAAFVAKQYKKDTTS